MPIILPKHNGKQSAPMDMALTAFVSAPVRYGVIGQKRPRDPERPRGRRLDDEEWVYGEYRCLEHEEKNPRKTQKRQEEETNSDRCTLAPGSSSCYGSGVGGLNLDPLNSTSPSTYIGASSRRYCRRRSTRFGQWDSMGTAWNSAARPDNCPVLLPPGPLLEGCKSPRAGESASLGFKIL
ncbi:hypothetical protein CSOJ01_09275 [Colletotrichum sojae]|uniref:Uncharacterized protein n=1 Tax=Colletotrichum sojae TaxID=2175907 RepID=A0A8H6J3P0_9PEZI|nr:hypothetical protein CSOJ01_09275 [Colletotrichum sojae]